MIELKKLAVIAMAVSSMIMANAQTNYNYEKPAGADNFYHSYNVTEQQVSFPNLYKSTVAGTLYKPYPMKQGAKYPAIVVGHPMGAVRQQAAQLYAQKMAEAGFVTLAIDLPYWGESEGEPRNAVAPDMYAEAFSAGVDFLGTRPFVNREEIGAIGICGSGSFAISAAKIDPRIKAIATASMYNMGEVNRTGLGNSQSLSERKKILQEAAEQRYAEFEGADPILIGGTADEWSDSLNPIQKEFYGFYRTPRGEYTPASATPKTTTHPTMTSNVKFMNFYPFEDIETISPRPMLFITGSEAHSREFSEEAYRRAAEPKQLVVIPGADHVDLYDRVDMIPWNVLINFSQTNLVK